MTLKSVIRKLESEGALGTEFVRENTSDYFLLQLFSNAEFEDKGILLDQGYLNRIAGYGFFRRLLLKFKIYSGKTFTVRAGSPVGSAAKRSGRKHTKGELENLDDLRDQIHRFQSYGRKVRLSFLSITLTGILFIFISMLQADFIAGLAGLLFFLSWLPFGGYILGMNAVAKASAEWLEDNYGDIEILVNQR